VMESRIEIGHIVTSSAVVQRNIWSLSRLGEACALIPVYNLVLPSESVSHNWL
jgi:hypothetical protein